MNQFPNRIIQWQRKHGRSNLPWQGADAYRIWLSEIMLQQTQVVTVIPYYLRFLESFPSVEILSAASEDAVLSHWSGLGYYSRARNLHRAAQIVMQQHKGVFPRDFEAILALPGIGRSTSAAICALAFNQRHAILDGNVKRVLARYCGIEGYPGEKKIELELWQQAEALLPKKDMAIYTQGLMDVGALICTRSKPLCSKCPLQVDCVAYQTDQVARLPTPRPRKILPEKFCTLLLLRNGADILLERRPGSGIWGGLWCPPQLDKGQDVNAYCAQYFGESAKDAEMLPVFTHTFTHFKLHISPLSIRIKRESGRAEQSGCRVWVDMEDALHAAIPTPVRKLLLELRSRYATRNTTLSGTTN